MNHAKRKMHLHLDLRNSGHVYRTICGKRLLVIDVTNDPERVTCKNCLQILQTRAEKPV